MKKTTFRLDALGDLAVEGYSLRQSWNGWDAPAFTFEQADQLREMWLNRGWHATYDGSSDSFEFSVNQDLETGESEEVEKFEAVEVDGMKLYPIGAGSWMWEELDF